MTSKVKPISKKRKFVKDGIFFAELNDVLAHEFADNGYSGCEVRVTPKCTEVYIRATHTKEVAGENNRRIREMRALIQKRFKYQPGQIKLYTAAVQNKGLSALAQAQAVKYRLLQGLSVRLAAYSVVKLIMDQRGAKGCEVVVSGKLRGQRAKAMKFRQGYMIHAGDAKNYYVEKAVKHVHLRQGVIGIKVKIMLPHDPTGESGVARELPDTVTIHEPKDEPVVIEEETNEDEDNENENDANDNDNDGNAADNNNAQNENADNNQNDNQGGGNLQAQNNSNINNQAADAVEMPQHAGFGASNNAGGAPAFQNQNYNQNQGQQQQGQGQNQGQQQFQRFR